MKAHEFLRGENRPAPESGWKSTIPHDDAEDVVDLTEYGFAAPVLLDNYRSAKELEREVDAFTDLGHRRSEEAEGPPGLLAGTCRAPSGNTLGRRRR